MAKENCSLRSEALLWEEGGKERSTYTIVSFMQQLVIMLASRNDAVLEITTEFQVYKGLEICLSTALKSSAMKRKTVEVLGNLLQSCKNSFYILNMGPVRYVLYKY